MTYAQLPFFFLFYIYIYIAILNTYNFHIATLYKLLPGTGTPNEVETHYKLSSMQ